MPTVWIVMPWDFAISAAFVGGTLLPVSLPSVSSTTTFCFAGLFSKSLMARPMASPIIVRGPAMPTWTSPQQLPAQVVVEGERRLQVRGLAEDEQADAVARRAGR